MSTDGYWWLALGLGLVAAGAAWLLLHLLYRQVRRVESGSGAIWEAGKQLAGNTATSWLLGETSVRLEALADEAEQHAAMVGTDSGPG